MPRINLPPGCAGFADGDKKYLAEKGSGSFVNLDSDRDANALRKLKNQDYASAGLVDAGPQKEFILDSRRQGRWCRSCNRIWHSWTKVCRCGNETIPESDMTRELPEEYTPLSGLTGPFLTSELPGPALPAVPRETKQYHALPARPYLSEPCRN